MNLLRSECLDNVSQSQHLKDLEYAQLLKEVSHPNQLNYVWQSESLDDVSQERSVKLKAMNDVFQSIDPPKKRRVELTLNFPKKFPD